MSIPTDSNRELLTVVATMRAKPGREDELQAALAALVEPTLAEDGCHTYALHRGTTDPAEFAFYENWTSQSHLDAHLATPHIEKFLPQIPELVDGELVIRSMRRVA
jgi:quinol monooxygenase YgiN